jgi:glycosyltransferase involved in cell wall biosynthesis
VIPAFNAERTIAETLASVRSQTHRTLEILVVDDGSADDTHAIVQSHALEDSRIRLMTQANAGVAAARNAGAAIASGDFIAPVDADDLWHPRKIERQLEIFGRAGPRTGLVYTWFALIDRRSHVLQLKYRPDFDGNVLAELAYYNFIGNGSSALIRRSAFEQTPGYDQTLKCRGGQGCEDWKLYFQIAERHDFGVVRAPLTGYRTAPDNMSSNVLQMLRSRDLAIQDLLPTHPELAPAFRAGRNRLSRFLFHRALQRGRPPEIAKLVASIGRHDPLFLARLLATLPVTASVGLAGRLFATGAYQGRNVIPFAELDEGCE